MTWFIALIPPALWSITNYIDKYLISKYFKGGSIGALMIFSSIIGVFIMPVIYFFEKDVLNIELLYILILIINGAIYIFGMLPYFYALEKDEASVVVPLFQLIPIFSYILAIIFLKETLSVLQILASLIIIFGAMLLSYDLENRKVKFKIFCLMFLASFLVALNGLIFKIIAIKSNFLVTSFWEYCGFILVAIFLYIFIRSYRKQFLKVLKYNKVSVLSINGLNEIINIIAKMIMNFATLLMPLAIAWVANGFQPFFIFLFGIIITLFFPRLGKENIKKSVLTQKFIAIAIMFIGVILLNNNF